MKKSLIALAVASVVSSSAFAATANVDVYGKLHMSVSLFDDQPAGINDVQISSNASRIGFKGAEDLGGGMKGIWQIEQTVNLDEANGTFATRNSFVGLAGGFGTTLIGNHDTPLKLVGRAVDLFGDTLADSRNVLGGGSDTRAKNVAMYMTPDMGGFGIAAAYSTDLNATSTPQTVTCVPVTVVTNSATTPQTTAVVNNCSTVAAVSGNRGDADDSSIYNVNATYKNGPLFVGLGYGDGDGHENLGWGAHMRAAAGFTFGSFKLVGQYDRREDDSSTVGTQHGDFDAWMGGAAFTMGALTLKANYMQGEFDGDANAITTVNGVTALRPQRSTDIEQWTVGADYQLSKRTTAYALYAQGENVTFGGGVGSSDQIGSGVAGGDISVVSLGMQHSF